MRGLFGNPKLYSSTLNDDSYDSIISAQLNEAAYHYHDRYQQLREEFDFKLISYTSKQYMAAQSESGYIIDLDTLRLGPDQQLRIVDAKNPDKIIGIASNNDECLAIFSEENIEIRGSLRHQSCLLFSEENIEFNADIESRDSIEFLAANVLMNKGAQTLTEHLAVSSAHCTQLRGHHRSQKVEVTAGQLDQSATIQSGQVFYLAELAQHNGKTYAEDSIERIAHRWVSTESSVMHTPGVIQTSAMDCVDKGSISSNVFDGMISQYLLDAEIICGSGGASDQFSLNTETAVSQSQARLSFNCNVNLHSDWLTSLKEGVRVSSEQQLIEWKLLVDSHYGGNRLIDISFDSDDTHQPVERISPSYYTRFKDYSKKETEPTEKQYHKYTSTLGLDLGGSSYLGDVNQEYRSHEITFSGDLTTDNGLSATQASITADKVKFTDETIMPNTKVYMDRGSLDVDGLLQVDELMQKGRNFTLHEDRQFKANKARHDLTEDFKTKKKALYAADEAYIRAKHAYTRGTLEGRKLVMEADTIINRGKVYYDNQTYFAQLYLSTGTLIANESIQTNALAVLRFGFIKTPYDCVTTLLNINASFNIHFGKPRHMDLKRKFLFATNSILTLSSFLIPGAAGICSLIRIPVNVLPQLAGIISSYSQFMGMFDGPMPSSTHLISTLERILMMGSSMVLGILGGVSAAEHFSAGSFHLDAPLLTQGAFDHMGSMDEVFNSPIFKCANALSAALASVTGRTTTSLVDIDASAGIIASDLKYSAFDVSLGAAVGLTGSTTSAFVADFSHNGELLGHSTRAYAELTSLDTDTLLGVNQISAHHLDVYSDRVHHEHQSITADEATFHSNLSFDRSALNIDDMTLGQELGLARSSYTGDHLRNEGHFNAETSTVHLGNLQNGHGEHGDSEFTTSQSRVDIDHVQNEKSASFDASGDDLHIRTLDNQGADAQFTTAQSKVEIDHVSNAKDATFVASGDDLHIKSFDNAGTKVVYSSKGEIEHISNSGKEQTIQSEIDTQHEDITGDGITADDLVHGHRGDVIVHDKGSKFTVRASDEQIDDLKQHGGRTTISGSHVESKSIVTDDGTQLEIDDSNVHATNLETAGHVDAQNSEISADHYKGPIAPPHRGLFNLGTIRAEADAVSKHHSSAATAYMANWNTDHVNFKSGDMHDQSGHGVHMSRYAGLLESRHPQDIKVTPHQYKERVADDGSLVLDYGDSMTINGTHTYDTVVPLYVKGKHGAVGGQLVGSGPVQFETEDDLAVGHLDAKFDNDVAFVAHGMLTGVDFKVLSKDGRISYVGDKGVSFKPKITHHERHEHHSGWFSSSDTTYKWDTAENNTSVGREINVESKDGAIHEQGTDMEGERITAHAHGDVDISGTKTHTTVDHRGGGLLYHSHDHLEQDGYVEAHMQATKEMILQSDTGDVIKTGVEQVAPDISETGNKIITTTEGLTSTQYHHAGGITASIAGFQISGPDAFNMGNALQQVQSHESLVGSTQALLDADNPADMAVAAVKEGSELVNTFNHVANGIANGNLGKELVQRAGLDSFKVGIGSESSSSESHSRSGGGICATNYTANARDSIEFTGGVTVQADHGSLHAPHVRVEGAELEHHSKSSGWGVGITGSFTQGINGGYLNAHSAHGNGTTHQLSAVGFKDLDIETDDLQVKDALFHADKAKGYIHHADLESSRDIEKSTSWGVNIAASSSSFSVSGNYGNVDDAMIHQRSEFSVGDQSGLHVDSLHNTAVDSNVKADEMTETRVDEHSHHIDVSVGISHTFDSKSDAAGASHDVVSIPFEGRVATEDTRAYDDASGHHVISHSKSTVAVAIPTINSKGAAELKHVVNGSSKHFQTTAEETADHLQDEAARDALDDIEFEREYQDLEASLDQFKQIQLTLTGEDPTVFKPRAQQSNPDPQPSTSDPQPVTSDPQPATSDPQPVTSDPQPVTSDPQPVTSDPQPVTSDPQPVTSDPQPVTSDPQPVATEHRNPLDDDPIWPGSHPHQSQLDDDIIYPEDQNSWEAAGREAAKLNPLDMTAMDMLRDPSNVDATQQAGGVVTQELTGIADGFKSLYEKFIHHPIDNWLMPQAQAVADQEALGVSVTHPLMPGSMPDPRDPAYQQAEQRMWAQADAQDEAIQKFIHEPFPDQVHDAFKGLTEAVVPFLLTDGLGRVFDMGIPTAAENMHDFGISAEPPLYHNIPSTFEREQIPDKWPLLHADLFSVDDITTREGTHVYKYGYTDDRRLVFADSNRKQEFDLTYPDGTVEHTVFYPTHGSLNDYQPGYLFGKMEVKDGVPQRWNVDTNHYQLDMKDPFNEALGSHIFNNTFPEGAGHFTTEVIDNTPRPESNPIITQPDTRPTLPPYLPYVAGAEGIIGGDDHDYNSWTAAARDAINHAGSDSQPTDPTPPHTHTGGFNSLSDDPIWPDSTPHQRQLGDDIIYPEDQSSWDAAAREGFKPHWQQTWDYEVRRMGTGLEHAEDDIKGVGIFAADAAAIATYPILEHFSDGKPVIDGAIQRMEERGEALWEHAIKPTMNVIGDGMTMSATTNPWLQHNPDAQWLYDQAHDRMEDRARQAFDATSDWLAKPFDEQVGDALEKGTRFGVDYATGSALNRFLRFAPEYTVSADDISYVYRGTYLTPEDAFSHGFKAPGENMDIHSHTHTGAHGDPELFDETIIDSGYVATSESREVAATFPLQPTLDGVDQRYVYMIRRPDGAIDVVNDVYFKDELYLEDPAEFIESNEAHIEEREHAIPENVSSEDIIGAWPVNMHGMYLDEQGWRVPLAEDGSVDHFGLRHHEAYDYGKFMHNPFYSGPADAELIESFGKSMQHQLTDPSIATNHRYRLFQPAESDARAHHSHKDDAYEDVIGFDDDSVGAGKIKKIDWKSVDQRLDALGLPKKGEGDIGFVPRKRYRYERPLTTGDHGGYLDRDGNEWVKGDVRSHRHGDTHEWDVRLSAKGLRKYKEHSKLFPGGRYINVSPGGKITH
jgi:hypothetical protein